MRQSRKMISRAIASSVCDPVMPSMKTRSRANDVITITASKIWNEEIGMKLSTNYKTFPKTFKTKPWQIAPAKFSTDLKQSSSAFVKVERKEDVHGQISHSPYYLPITGYS